MIRSIRPTDLLTLAYFNGRSRGNEVRTVSTLGRKENGSLPATAFVKHWLSLEENRHTWIYLRNHQIKGLISARSSSDSSIWEVDRLQLAKGENYDLYLDLLDYLCLVGGETGMEKVFLRFPKDSPLVEIARHAGFTPYLVEVLYGLDQRGRNRTRKLIPFPEGLRAKTRADDHSLFQLYNATMPDHVRRLQAMTLREWQETRGLGWEKRNKREYAAEKDGVVVAWLGISKQGSAGHIEIMVHPSHEDLLDSLLSYAIAYLSDRLTILALVPEMHSSLRSSLMTHGFDEGEKYETLIKELTVRLRHPRLVPMRVWGQAPH